MPLEMFEELGRHWSRSVVLWVVYVSDRLLMSEHQSLLLLRLVTGIYKKHPLLRLVYKHRT